MAALRATRYGSPGTAPVSAHHHCSCRLWVKAPACHAGASGSSPDRSAIDPAPSGSECDNLAEAIDDEIGSVFRLTDLPAAVAKQVDAAASNSAGIASRGGSTPSGRTKISPS